MFFPTALSALLSITLSSGQFPFFSGVKTNFSLTEFLTQEWKPCLDISYDDYLPNFNETLQANCQGEYLLIGCYLPAVNSSMVVGAMGLKSVVLTQTQRPQNIQNHRYRSFNIHNNVSWYFTDDYSFGFAPEDAYIYQKTFFVTIMHTITRTLLTHKNIVYVGLSIIPSWQQVTIVVR